ncbi:MAG: DUF1624 domain-containing protein [Comamonadaceae bacterium]|nr:DUF1624 domain-containing protein [Comamonadaceae bacterium]
MREIFLDIIRGMAVLMMITNHLFISAVGYRGMITIPFQNILSFTGSAAPVIFYFTTGYGISIRKVQPTINYQLKKTAPLFFADWLLTLYGGHLYGLDFFGFIAIATSVAWAASKSKTPIALSLALIAFALILRF